MTKYFAAFAVILVLTCTGSLLSGTLTGRWAGRQEEMALAVHKLEQFPTEIGPWKMVKEEELSDFAQSILNCSASVNRTYFNEELGAYVNVALLLGPFGPICVHTPEICYSSHDYTAEGDRVQQTFQSIEAGPEDSFWKLTFRSNKRDDIRLRVFYGYSHGDQFQASENPRWDFAGSPYLFKVQLSSVQQLKDNVESADAAEQFIADILPELKSHLVTPRNRW